MNVTPRPRILICRLSAVGDCILTLPVLCALRDSFPEAFLGWIVQEGAAPLLKGHACLDRLIVVKKGWLRSMHEIQRLRAELRTLRFDIAVDVQSLTKSAFVAWLSGARERVGFAGPQGRELAPWLDTVRIKSTREHVVDRYLELLSPLGIHHPEARFEVPQDTSACGTIETFLRHAKVEGNFAVFSPGAGWASKVWPVDRYRPVSEFLYQQYQLKTVVVWAGDQERGWGEQIVARLENHCLLAPRTTLQDLAALLKRATVFIGPDTGPLHLAAALGVPCVGLYGPTSPAVSGPYGGGHICLREEGLTSTRMRSSSNEAMRRITVEAVCQACEMILKRQS